MGKSYTDLLSENLDVKSKIDFTKLPLTIEIKSKNADKYIHQIEVFKNGYIVTFYKNDNGFHIEADETKDFELVVETMDFGIVFQETNGKISYANSAAQNILGLTYEQLTGRDSMHPEWKSVHADGSPFPGNEHPAMVSLATGKVVKNEIMGVYHPDTRSYVWILINSYPVFKTGLNQVDGVFASFKDITAEILSKKELEYQLEMSGILIDATTKFININLDQIDEEINKLLGRLGSFMNVDRFYVFNYNFEKNLATNTHEWCGENIIPQKENLQDFPIQFVSNWVEQNKQGKPFIVENTALLPDDDNFKHVLLEQDIKSIYCMPVMLKGECIGMVGFDAVKQQHIYNNSEKQLLEVFAELIANIEDRKKTNILINETLKELNGVYQISQLNMAMNMPVSEYFNNICEVIKASFSSPNKTYVCIEYLNIKYTTKTIKQTQNFTSKDLIVNETIKIGKLLIYIDDDIKFLPSETEFVETIVRLITQKYNKDLFEQTLQASEEKYRIIADNNYNWEFWEAPDGTFLYHSPSCKNITGYTAEEMLADQNICHNLMHSEDIEGYAQHKQEVTANKCSGKHNFRIISRDGSLKYIEHVCQPVYSKNGYFLGTRGTNLDVTEKVLTFNELSKSEQRLNNLLNSQTSYVLRTDLRGIHTYWNQAFEEAFGWMYKENGLTEADSLTSICDYDKPKAQDTVIKCIKEPGKIFKVQLDKPAKDGSIVHTAWDFVCITDDLGNPLEIQCIGIDITDSVKAFNKIQESEKWLESLLSSQTSFVLRTNMLGQHTYWNHAFEEKFGWIYENGLNNEDSLKSICEYHHPRTLEAVNECIAEPGKIVKVELDKPGHNNTIRTTLWEFVCLTNSLGEPTEIQCMGIDITEKRDAEKKLSESEENYRTLFENAPDPILLLGEDGNFIDCNNATCRLLQYNKEDIIGKKPHDISPKVQANGKASDTYAGEIINEILKTGKKNFEWIHQKSNGELVLVSISITIISYSGNNILLTAWRDITELRQAELAVKTLSTVTEQNPLGILITNLNGEIEYVNASLIQMSGYNKQELIGAKPSIFKSGLTSSYIIDDLWNNLKKGREWQGKFYNKRKNGEIYIAQASIAPIKNAEGNITHYFAVEEDITQKEQMVANMQASEKRFTELAKHSKTVVWEVNETGLYTYLSDAAFEVYGYKPKELVNKVYIFNMTPENEREKYKAEGFEFLNNAKNIEGWLNPKTRKDGNIIWTISNGKPIIDNLGKVIGYRGVDNDVTAQVEAEQKLRKSEEKYRLLFDVSPDPILIYDLKGNILEFNTATCKLLSLNKSDIENKNVLAFSAEVQHNKKANYHDLFNNYNITVIENGLLSYEWILQLKKQPIIHIMVSCVAIEYNNQQAIYATWKDITAIKNAQEETNRFKTIIEQAAYGTGITDLDGKLLYLNKAFANMHGYKPHELIGKDLSVFHSPAQLPEVGKLVNQIKEKGGFTNEEVGHARKDGTEFPTLMSAKLIVDEDGTPNFLSATCIDISEKVERETIIKEQNEKLNAIIEALPDMIFINDSDGKYLDYFRSNNNTKHKDYSYLIGKKFADVFDEENTKYHLQNVNFAIKTGQMVTYEYSLNNNNQIEFYEARLVKMSENTVLRFVRDITDRKRTEQLILDLNQNLEQKIQERTEELKVANVELEKAKITADKANEAKSIFLSRMSHELRTPMNAILGFAQLLEMTNLDEKQQKSVGHILKSGNHLLNLINEVLDIARIESGRIGLSVESVSANHIINEVVELVYPMATARKINIEFKPNDVLYIMADKQRLKQILINVINNAIKYNHVGGHVNILVKENNRNVRISVTDNGFGISKENIDKIFTPFERIGADKHEIEGTGLGLSVVKQLMESMNGLYGVESELGKGSTFWFEFKNGGNHEETINGIKGTIDNEKITTENASISSKIILYIEDNFSNIELVETIINNARPEVNLITNTYGANAVTLAKQYKPQLILLDLNLPDMHGSEVLDKLKIDEETKNIPVVIVSADAMEKQINYMLNLGAKTYLTKPIQLKELLKIIDTYLN